METITVCKLNYGFHYRIIISLYRDKAYNNTIELEGWSECIDWDENLMTSTNPYTGSVDVVPLRNAYHIHMEVIDDDKN